MLTVPSLGIFFVTEINVQVYEVCVNIMERLLIDKRCIVSLM